VGNAFLEASADAATQLQTAQRKHASLRAKADARLRRCKVILLTGRTQKDDRTAGTQAGADAYLVKPFSPLEVLTAVQRLI